MIQETDSIKLWIRGTASILLLEGRWFDFLGLHVKVSLGKILNLKLLLMCWSAPCMAAHRCMNYCKRLLNVDSALLWCKLPGFDDLGMRLNNYLSHKSAPLPLSSPNTGSASERYATLFDIIPWKIMERMSEIVQPRYLKEGERKLEDPSLLFISTTKADADLSSIQVSWKSLQ